MYCDPYTFDVTCATFDFTYTMIYILKRLGFFSVTNIVGYRLMMYLEYGVSNAI